MYNYDIYRLTLYKTSNFIAINIYSLQQVINNLHDV